MEPNFNLNRPKVSDEEINKHKDFDNLVKQFKEQSIQKARNDSGFLKNKKVTYASIIAGVTVICTLTYLTVFKKQDNKQATNDKTTTSQNTNTVIPNQTKAFITPPLQKLKVPYSTYKVNAASGGELAHHTSSKLKIPKNAFVNKNGQDIVGEVEIQYREFHDQADIIASGIPMTYDSAGTQYHFESAGMFDVKGYQNGEPIFIKPNKTIQVELASNEAANRFNQYELDTIAKNWKCLGKDVAIKNESKPALQTRAELPSLPKSEKAIAFEKKIEGIPRKIDSVKTVYTQKINKLPVAIIPSKPAKSTGRPKFELEVDYKDFPELAAFQNSVFEVGDENKNYTKSLHEVTWSSAIISEGPQKGKNYLLTLTHGNRNEKLIVYPVLSGANYETAVKQYEKKFNDYSGLLVKRNADEKRLKEEMELKQKAYMEDQKKLSAELVKEQIRIRREMEQQMEEQFKTMGNNQKVMRVFSVSRFNIYNSDCAGSMPQGASIDPIYSINKGASSITPNAIYLVEHGKNRVYSLQYGRLFYDPNVEYSLCVMANGQMYLCSKEVLMSTLNLREKKIPLQALSTEVNDVADLRKALGI